MKREQSNLQCLRKGNLRTPVSDKGILTAGTEPGGEHTERDSSQPEASPGSSGSQITVHLMCACISYIVIVMTKLPDTDNLRQKKVLLIQFLSSVHHGRNCTGTHSYHHGPGSKGTSIPGTLLPLLFSIYSM